MIFLILPLWIYLGAIHFRVQSLKRLAETKELSGVGLSAKPRFGRVFWIYSFGYGLAGIVTAIIVVPVIGILVAVSVNAGLVTEGLEFRFGRQYAELVV